MKTRMFRKLFASVLFITGSFMLTAQAAEPIPDPQVIFLNTGAMNIAANGTMFVVGDVQMLTVGSGTSASKVEVILDGDKHITGSFFHNAVGNVFKTDNNDWTNRELPRGITTSRGNLHFVDLEGDGTTHRFITTLGNNPLDRRTNYIAFPNLILRTHDEIIVTPRMGIDARSIRRCPKLPFGQDQAINNQSALRLQSRQEGNEIWTASLRITSNARIPADVTAFSLGAVDGVVHFVDVDAVIVEKYVYSFREITGDNQPSERATLLMPFSPPFFDMRAGYFAGNWVRRPIFEEDINGVWHRTGNRPSATNTALICHSQFMTQAMQTMGRQARQTTATAAIKETTSNSRQAYFIRLKPQGFNFGDLELQVTANENQANTHNIQRFVFDGFPFEGMGPRTNRRLFAGHPVLNETMRAGNETRLISQSNATHNTNTQAWLAGNSYTAALNVRGIAEHLMSHAQSTRDKTNPAWFWGTIDLFYHGATAYERLNIWNSTTNAVDAVVDHHVIHPMGVFMIHGWVGNGQRAEQIVIGPEFQIHAGAISSTPPVLINPVKYGELATRSSVQMQSSSLNFVLTPADNPMVFSRHEIMFSRNATGLNANSEDIASMVSACNSLFHLYGTNATNSRLQRNALPFTAQMALLAVNPAADQMTVTLTALNADEFAAQRVILYDTKTGIEQDLRFDNSYTFVLTPGDNPNRFEVHFAARATTYNPEVPVHNNHWLIHNDRNELNIVNLHQNLMGETIQVFNVAGVLQRQQLIGGSTETINISDLPIGVYLITIQGRTEKFLK